MPVIPNIPTVSGSKRCAHCNRVLPFSQFSKTFSEFFEDGYLSLCNDCISEKIHERDGDWEYINRVCQWANIPWVVKEWERIQGFTLENETWAAYAKVFSENEYETIGWDYYYVQYKKLKDVGLIEEEIPEVKEQRYRSLVRKWGENYSEEELNRLEDLYSGLLNTQNINGALQIDQAQKICKLSLEIDSRIRAGDKDVDKFMSSYDKLVKMAEFTPKNTKNAADFDSFGELAYWLEKRGHLNKFYDNVTRDIVDETLKNIESYNQRLYVNEGGIGEEITERLQNLRLQNQTEDQIYNIQPDFDVDEYDNAAFVIDEEEDFNPDGEAPPV